MSSAEQRPQSAVATLIINMIIIVLAAGAIMGAVRGLLG